MSTGSKKPWDIECGEHDPGDSRSPRPRETAQFLAKYLQVGLSFELFSRPQHAGSRNCKFCLLSRVELEIQCLGDPECQCVKLAPSFEASGLTTMIRLPRVSLKPRTGELAN